MGLQWCNTNVTYVTGIVIDYDIYIYIYIHIPEFLLFCPARVAAAEAEVAQSSETLYDDDVINSIILRWCQLVY
jgi:hypothetical protein